MSNKALYRMKIGIDDGNESDLQIINDSDNEEMSITSDDINDYCIEVTKDFYYNQHEEEGENISIIDTSEIESEAETEETATHSIGNFYESDDTVSTITDFENKFCIKKDENKHEGKLEKLRLLSALSMESLNSIVENIKDIGVIETTLQYLEDWSE
ncbi:hypothetical protein PVAND_004330 [Polypedilum vanderplanki]|uniref:Uncharacterized protein n=1 Tax=Polypedilum vanderplanki TaxID=319348 RepID=A0A9J6BXS9_POLVA|nr:hypothetical protein PVAND_004330 [Polypedilum vanderplanki]